MCGGGCVRLESVRNHSTKRSQNTTVGVYALNLNWSSLYKIYNLVSVRPCQHCQGDLDTLSSLSSVWLCDKPLSRPHTDTLEAGWQDMLGQKWFPSMA